MPSGLFGMFSSHKCGICGKETKEILDQFKGPRWLCRAHLIDLFTKDFLAYSDKMLIFHPEFDKVCKTLYGYYPLAEMDWFTFKNEVVLNIRSLLDYIAGHCSQCQNKAQVLYFPKSFLDYSGSTPHIEKVHPDSGELLCMNHVLEKIRTDLELNPGFYSEGLFVPYAKAGMYVSNYL